MNDTSIHTFLVNTSPCEYFVPTDLLPEGMGDHALAILLQEKDGLLEGRWAGDALYLVAGESCETILHRVAPQAGRNAFDLLCRDYLDLPPCCSSICGETRSLPDNPTQ